MLSLSTKIMNPNGNKPEEFMSSSSQALLRLEINSDLKDQLRELNITVSKDVEAGGSWKAIYNLCSGSSTEVFPKSPSPAGMRAGDKVQWEAQCLYHSGEFCLSQLKKAVQRISKNIPGAAQLIAMHDWRTWFSQVKLWVRDFA